MFRTRDEGRGVITGWTFVGSSIEGRAFEIVPGVNVWSQKWRDVQGATIAQRLDNIPYGSQGGFNVYEIDGPNGPLHFVAGEVSNQIYAFYLSDTSGQNC